MKFLVVGDVQAKKENLHLVRRLLQDVEQQNCLEVIWLGDLLDRRGHIEAEVLNTFFTYFSNSYKNHFIVCGNHDLLSVMSEETALEPLKALSNVAVIDKPWTYHSNDRLLFVPYYRNPEKFLAAISSMPKDEKPKALICHQGVKEFTLGSGYTEDEAVPLEALKDFNLVIAGHYHTPMEKGNVVYLGSPFSHSFGESNERKRLGIFDTKSLALDFLRTDYPTHRTFEIAATDTLPAVSDRDYNRVIVSGTEEEIKTFQKISGEFLGIKFIYRPKGGPSVALQENMPNSDKWIKWAKEIKKLNQATIDLGLELLK